MDRKKGNRVLLKIMPLIVVSLMLLGMVGSVYAFSGDDVIVSHQNDYDDNISNITVEIQNNDNLESVTIYETNSTHENQSELESWSFDSSNESQELHYEWSDLESGEEYYYKVEVQHTNDDGDLDYYNTTKTIDFSESSGGAWSVDVDWTTEYDLGWFVASLWMIVSSIPVILVIIAVLIYVAYKRWM